MKGAVVPMRSCGIRWLLRSTVQDDLQHACPQRPRVLRHKKHVGALVDAHFSDEFGERTGVRQIQACTWLAAVTVPTGDHGNVPLGRQFIYLSVLFPTS